MAYLYTELLILLLILIGNFIFGVAPFYILRFLYGKHYNSCSRKNALAFLTYFGGGVFMSVCFLDLQNAASEQYEAHHHTPYYKHASNKENKTEKQMHSEEFPIPELYILCAFFIVFAIEELTQFFTGGCQKKASSKLKKIPFCSCAKRHTECSRTFKASRVEEQTLYGLEKQITESERLTHLPEYLISKKPGDSDLEHKLLGSSVLSHPIPNYGTVVTNLVQLDTTPPVTIPPLLVDEQGKVAVIKPPPVQRDHTPFSTYLLLAITLTIYNIYQGVYLMKLMRDAFTWLDLIQCVKQFIISFVAGSIVSQDSRTSLPVMCYIGLLSVMCPLGISATMIFEQALSHVTHLYLCILNASLCGSLLYLTFFDLLRRSTLHNSPSLGKFVSFTLGFVIITSLQYISVTS